MSDELPPARRSGRQRRPRPLLPNPAQPGTLLVPLTRGYFAIIDEADGPAVGRYTWSARKKRHIIYAGTHLPRTFGGKQPMIELHRFLWRHWGMPDTPEIDHRNRDGLDCRRENLRAATVSQNHFNRRASSNNVCGIKGVRRSKNGSRWTASIQLNGKTTRLGPFPTAEEAGRAYAEAAARIAGEFARSS